MAWVFEGQAGMARPLHRRGRLCLSGWGRSSLRQLCCEAMRPARLRYTACDGRNRSAGLQFSAAGTADLESAGPGRVGTHAHRARVLRLLGRRRDFESSVAKFRTSLFHAEGREFADSRGHVSLLGAAAAVSPHGRDAGDGARPHDGLRRSRATANSAEYGAQGRGRAADWLSSSSKRGWKPKDCSTRRGRNRFRRCLGASGLSPRRRARHCATS